MKNTPEQQTLQHDATYMQNVSECMSGAGNWVFDTTNFRGTVRPDFWASTQWNYPESPRIAGAYLQVEILPFQKQVGNHTQEVVETWPGVRDGPGDPTCSKCTANTSGPPGPPRLDTTSTLTGGVTDSQVSKIYSLHTIYIYRYMVLYAS